MRHKTFTHFPKRAIAIPSLTKVQRDSYKWFLDKGFKELFEDFSPITDYSAKKLALSFLDYRLDEPEHTEQEAITRNLNYEAPLRITVRLENLQTKEVKEQEVYIGQLPLMTRRGTFISNGVERAVVSQLLRSPGVYFSIGLKKGVRCFGAEVIPSRGAWLEFETEFDGAQTVKIDRKRKVAATALLRAFGYSTNEKIKEAFKDILNSDDKKVKAEAERMLEQTLAMDTSGSSAEAFIEIFRRLRPGELATEDNAKDLIEKMFGFERYDLERVGRWKMEQRLGRKTKLEDIKREDRSVRGDDFVAVMKEIVRLNSNPKAQTDDIDHLGNRRVRPVGILLQDRLRAAFSRIERIVKDRMSTLDPDTLTPGQLVHANPLIAAIQEFFGSSRLSQFMDQINPLAELEHKRRLSAKGPGGLSQERAGFEVRDVHVSHYGRICPIQTPEGPNIGLVVHLSTHARLNELGFLETPYFKVNKGVVTNEVDYLNALDEQKYIIAHAGVATDDHGKIINKQVEARQFGHPAVVNSHDVHYMDVSPQQCLSVGTGLIPFLEHDDANRALMGSNMQRQAVPCILPQAPLVATGMEANVARDAGYTYFAEEDGTVATVDAKTVVVKAQSGQNYEYDLLSFMRSNQYSAISQRPIVRLGQKVKKGEALAEGSATDDHMLALGQNLLVAFIPWFGGNFEDAIVISERAVKDDVFTSVHIEDYTCDVRETKLGPEVTTYDIPNVSESKLANLDESGVIRVGAEVEEGDILVGKISPKGEAELTGEERLLRAVFGEKAREVRDTSRTLSHGKRGRVIDVKVFEREKGDRLPAGVIKSIQVEVATIRKISVGDKLAGRHGNKGVISRILPLEDMPRLEDGTAVDIVLNPLGVASRMNIGQILEMHLGWAAAKQNYRAITPSLAGVTEDEIRAELKAAGLPEDGKVALYDGRTGEAFANRVAVGIVYMMKLNHLVEDKMHARSIGSYSLTTQQPLGGKAQFGGQRFGEMEVWALEGYGAAHTLQEMLTIKSDDVTGRARAYEAITKGERIDRPGVPASFNVLLAEMKGLCLDPQMLTSSGTAAHIGSLEEEESVNHEDAAATVVTEIAPAVIVDDESLPKDDAKVPE